MKISSNYELNFKQIPSDVKKAKSITKMLGMVTTLATAATGKDLFEKATQLSDEQMENSYYNMLDMVEQVNKMGYSKTNSEKYDAFLKKAQISIDNAKKKTLKVTEIDDFVNELVSLFI